MKIPSFAEWATVCCADFHEKRFFVSVSILCLLALFALIFATLSLGQMSAIVFATVCFLVQAAAPVIPNNGLLFTPTNDVVPIITFRVAQITNTFAHWLKVVEQN